MAAALLLPACSSPASPEAESPSSQPTGAEKGKLTFAPFSLTVEVSVQPAPPKILKENELLIDLPPEQADRWKNAKVSVRLTMPSMDHGAVDAVAAYREPGQFAAKIVPTMVGEWQADITFEADGKTSTVAYPFVAEP